MKKKRAKRHVQQKQLKVNDSPFGASIAWKNLKKKVLPLFAVASARCKNAATVEPYRCELPKKQKLNLKLVRFPSQCISMRRI